MAKKSFIITAVLLICFLTCSFVGCKKKTPSQEEPQHSEATISAESLEMMLGDVETLIVSGASGTVEWKSNNESVATVNGGTVTATGFGETWIIASFDGTALYCKVTVSIENEAIPTIRLEGEIKEADGYSLKVIVGEKYTLSPVLLVGGKTAEASFTLTASDGIGVEGLTFTAAREIDDGKVTVSCEYDGEIYTLEISIKAGGNRNA